jgi:hypothetical protein
MGQIDPEDKNALESEKIWPFRTPIDSVRQ